jgi:hypothetical protein
MSYISGDNMNKIDIQITKAGINSFSVEFNEGVDLPSVSATINLYTPNNKKISTFSIGTRSWNDNKFDLPVNMIEPIKQIAYQLEKIVTIKCNAALGLLSNIEDNPL